MKSILVLISILYITTTSLNADIIMGVVPQQSPLRLLKVWSPITKYLSEQTGEKIIFKTEKSITTFEEVLYNGGYDFAYMSPGHYIISNKRQGYKAEIRANKNIKGILVMRKAESVQKLNDENIRYLFPSPNAFAATLLTKYDLINTYGVSLDTINKAKYVNSHDSVYKGISRGIGNIGGGIERTFNSLCDKTKNSLKIIHTTKAYPSHPFAFKPSMSKTTKKKIVDALLSMPKSYLQALKIKALKKVKDDEYESVEKLAIKLKIMPE